MHSSTAAVRYAKALFSLASEERRLSETRSEVEELAALVAGNDELRDSLMTPLHPADQRKAVFRAIAARGNLSALITKFCCFLIDQRRIVDFAGIAAEFERLADEDAGILTAAVISAGPLDDRRRDRLRRALSERTGREVRLDVSVDPSLVGGAIAKVGDLVFDGSLRSQLQQLQANLMGEGAKR